MEECADDSDGGFVLDYHSDSGCETPSDELPDGDPRAFRPGGYHPTSPFELLGSYRAVAPLGAGAFSTVWLCAQASLVGTGAAGSELAAVKISKARPSVVEAALDEVALLEELCTTKQHPQIVALMGHFRHVGPHGEHICAVFEVMGESLLGLARHHGGAVPLVFSRRVARHVLLALCFIHSRRIAHTDIKPENILLQRHDIRELSEDAARACQVFLSGDVQSTEPSAVQRQQLATLRPTEVHAKLADFGSAQRVCGKVTDDIQTLQYRSPEVILGIDWDLSVDVWSAACTFFELVAGEYLFSPTDEESWPVEEDHLLQVIELLGAYPPKEWALSGKHARGLLTAAGKLKRARERGMDPRPLPELLRAAPAGLSASRAEELAAFLLPMLRWEPRARWRASEALQHVWVRPDSVEAA